MIEFQCPQSSEECEPGQVRNEAALSISLLWLGRFFYKIKAITEKTVIAIFYISQYFFNQSNVSLSK